MTSGSLHHPLVLSLALSKLVLNEGNQLRISDWEKKKAVKGYKQGDRGQWVGRTVSSCTGLKRVPLKIHVHLEPLDVTLCGSRVFAGITEMKS